MDWKYLKPCCIFVFFMDPNIFGASVIDPMAFSLRSFLVGRLAQLVPRDQKDSGLLTNRATHQGPRISTFQDIKMTTDISLSRDVQSIWVCSIRVLNLETVTYNAVQKFIIRFPSYNASYRSEKMQQCLRMLAALNVQLYLSVTLYFTIRRTQIKQSLDSQCRTIFPA